ncbi:unnamed protein product [Allacma fusca]|uniref:Translation initiation factor beta propellor-like domain-containing protein n=1 Tax=Allacma fusca TaxID=39272 RepID=A0A8J2JXA0_9HEXA|nr:unnamed protein product [Allacma fusca]
MAEINTLIVRESFGTYGLQGPPFKPWDNFKKDEEEAKFAVISPAGNRFAVGNSSTVTIFDTQTGGQVAVIRHRMIKAELSPNGKYLIGWENPSQNTDNFKIWSIDGESGPSVAYALKLSKPPEVHFSGDEALFARLATNAVIFADVPEFPKTAKKTPESLNISRFSVSPGTGPVHVLCYVPATKSGMPSNARLFRYPDFETTIASRSFFQADRIDMKWNPRGNAVLLTASQDIDKTGKSYYGKSMLYYLDTKGEAATVQTDSDAPIIHAAEWCPNSNDFCVITGKMPNTRAAMFNNKCEVIFDMGISARNAVHFNAQGNLVVLGAFGNLGSGNIEVWEVRKLKKKISQTQVAAVTQLLWLNDGVHFVTATTAPRMQVDNNFKVWDFGCQMVHEWNAKKLFFGFQPFCSPTPPKFPDGKLEGLVQKLGSKPIPRREETQKATAYVPVHLRKKGGAGALVPKAQANQSKPESAQLSETEKKIKAARKKLDQIQKLKDQQKEGKVLEKNQLDKIATEASLIKEIQSLELE